MTTKITPDAAMNTLAEAGPHPEALASAWHIGRRERVLQRVLTSSAPLNATPMAGERRVSDAGVRRPTPGPVRRWGLVAAAAGVLVVLGLAAQVLLPVGAPGSPNAAQALGELADAVPGEPFIPDGAYELTVYEESGIYVADDGSTKLRAPYTGARSTWRAADGWAWARQTGEGAAYHIFPPVPRNYGLDAVPADPVLMEAYLRLRVIGSTSTDEAMFEAVKHTLAYMPTPFTTRVAVIRMLERIPGITVVENTTDQYGRVATRVSFVDETNRPGMVNSMYLDPVDTQLLAELKTVDGDVLYSCVYTERRIVDTLPDYIVEVLGTERREKTIS